MAPKITINNRSDETISLIPYSCKDGENSQEFLVRQKLAKNIPARGHIEVKPTDYDLSGQDPESQIRILFRAGEFPEKVKPKEEEEFFLYTSLAAKAKWELNLDKETRQVASGQSSSGANAAGPPIESQLRELKEEVEKLKKEFKALLDRIAALETAPRQRQMI